MSDVRAQLRSSVAAPQRPDGRHVVSGRGVREVPRPAAVAVAGRGRGRRRDRHPGPVPAQSAGGHPVLPQVVERTRLGPSATDHRQTPQLPRGLPHRDAVRGPLHGPVREQPGRSLSPTAPGAGASDAPVHICGPRATVSLGARPHPESLSCRPPPPAGRPSSALANTGLRCLARGDLRLKLKNGSPPHRRRSLPVQRQLDNAHQVLGIARQLTRRRSTRSTGSSPSASTKRRTGRQPV